MRKIFLMLCLFGLGYFFWNFCSGFFRFVSKDSAPYSIITKTDWKVLLENFFFTSVFSFLAFAVIALAIVVLRELNFINSKWYDKIFRRLYLILLSSIPALTLAATLTSDLFQLATTVVSFVALASPLVRKKFLNNLTDTKTTHEKPEHSEKP